MTDLALAAVIPALIAWAVISLLRRSALATRLADAPNHRSLHASPTPRLGGIGVIVAMLPLAFAGLDAAVASTLGCALGLAVVSLSDDFRSLPVEVRLPAHAVAAMVAVLAMAGPGTAPLPGGWIGAVLVATGLVWAANLFNFMDGADGLAGGMGAIGFGALAFAAVDSGQAMLAIPSAVAASACVGFLLHNFPPARVFLGDGGSVPLGFLAGSLGVLGALREAWPAWFPFLVFSPFVVDATATLAIRFVRGQPVWVAHRDHAYQRLALSGWSHRRLALAGYGLMAATAASALAARQAGAMVQCGILFFWAVLYGLLAWAVVRRTKRKADAARR